MVFVANKNVSSFNMEIWKCFQFKIFSYYLKCGKETTTSNWLSGRRDRCR